jgi:hypothetical protein
MYKIIPYKPNKTGHLAENYQAKEVRMSFCTEQNGELTQCHEFVKCRDFLGDVITYEYEGRNELIYGFTFNGNNPRIDKSRLSLLLQFKSEGAAKLFQKNMWLLEDYEKANHCHPTAIRGTDDPKVYWLTADKFWQKNIPVLSFFTYLLKCMVYKLPKIMDWKEYIKNTKYGSADYKLATPEADYMNGVTPEKLDFFGKHCYNMFKDINDVSGWDANEYFGKVHNNSGFVTIIRWGNIYKENKLGKAYVSYVNKHAKTDGAVPA